MPTFDMDSGVKLAPQQACPAGRHIVCSKKGGNDVLITQFADDQSPPDSEADYDTDLENEASATSNSPGGTSSTRAQHCLRTLDASTTVNCYWSLNGVLLGGNTSTYDAKC
ncbi:hypothetical protein LSAT2_031022 [Lamellibrachia satsuma]|nr:hypothetical protein LSAT2_031022 [Lamellibrachia satsuma]